MKESKIKEPRDVLRARANELRKKGLPRFLKMNEDLFLKGLELTNIQMDKGIRGFWEYVGAMYHELGEECTPYLKQWYIAFYSAPEISEMPAIISEMTPPEDVRKLDVENILKCFSYPSTSENREVCIHPDHPDLQLFYSPKITPIPASLSIIGIWISTQADKDFLERLERDPETYLLNLEDNYVRELEMVTMEYPGEPDYIVRRMEDNLGYHSTLPLPLTDPTPKEIIEAIFIAGSWKLKSLIEDSLKYGHPEARVVSMDMASELALEQSVPRLIEYLAD